MNITKNEQDFLYIIQNKCISVGKEFNILPSILGALAISTSNWGAINRGSNNLFGIPYTGRGKKYGAISGKIYNEDEEVDKDLDPIGVLQVYDKMQDSIYDYGNILTTSRRSPDGPFKYSKLIGERSYKNAINILERAEHPIFKYNYYTKFNILNIIEDYKLYEWDNI